jgi:hypothetical protein
MGLTIHYDLAAGKRSLTEARKLVTELRQRAMDLPFKEVHEIIEFKGEVAAKDDPERHFLSIQAGRTVEHDGRFYRVKPRHVIAFSAWPGDGCEEANFGLCQYPGFILIGDGSYPHRNHRLRTNLSGWSWHSFCKTQYASNPESGGVENLLDHAKSIGLLAGVKDEGKYWDGRNIEALANEVGVWNVEIAGKIAGLCEALGIEADALKRKQ